MNDRLTKKVNQRRSENEKRTVRNGLKSVVTIAQGHHQHVKQTENTAGEDRKDERQDNSRPSHRQTQHRTQHHVSESECDLVFTVPPGSGDVTAEDTSQQVHAKHEDKTSPAACERFDETAAGIERIHDQDQYSGRHADHVQDQTMLDVDHDDQSKDRGDGQSRPEHTGGRIAEIEPKSDYDEG